jgi:hypothetical protein
MSFLFICYQQVFNLILNSSYAPNILLLRCNLINHYLLSLNNRPVQLNRLISRLAILRPLIEIAEQSLRFGRLVVQLRFQVYFLKLQKLRKFKCCSSRIQFLHYFIVVSPFLEFLLHVHRLVEVDSVKLLKMLVNFKVLVLCRLFDRCLLLINVIKRLCAYLLRGLLFLLLVIKVRINL